jgi:hypothetical protein
LGRAWQKGEEHNYPAISADVNTKSFPEIGLEIAMLGGSSFANVAWGIFEHIRKRNSFVPSCGIQIPLSS